MSIASGSWNAKASQSGAAPAECQASAAEGAHAGRAPARERRTDRSLAAAGAAIIAPRGVSSGLLGESRRRRAEERAAGDGERRIAALRRYSV